MSRRGVLVAVVLVAAVAGGAFVAGMRATAPSGERTGAEQKAVYQCSMHPQIVSDKPGTCPICQMELQRVEGPPAGVDPGATSPAAEPAAGRRVLFYRHPMRPDVTSPEPGKDEMGMDYVPVYDEDAPAGTSDVPGHAPFTLTAERQQLIGVTIAPVERRALDLEIRTVGTVAYDPALYQAIVEYREGLLARGQLAGGAWEEAQRGADAIVRSALVKLRREGLSEEQIRDLARDGRDPVNLLLPGDSVWVYAKVYEYEVELVRPGQEVVVTTPAQPGATYRAKVTAVDSILDAATRTARVRALIPTPGGTLRPQTFVNVVIHVPLGSPLAVPEGTVLHTGEHQIAFVVKDEGRFEPRSVQLGREAQGYYEVLAGLAEGERVVTSANFLIDSESRFRAALAAFSKTAGAGHPH